jgi:hypothetical protein
MPRVVATAMMMMRRRNNPCGDNDDATIATCINPSCTMQQPTNNRSSKGDAGNDEDNGYDHNDTTEALCAKKKHEKLL